MTSDAASGREALWTKPKYPGDAVRILMLYRGEGRDAEIGDIRIQDYGKSVRVGTFLPGDSVCLPGDSPKTEPEKSEWCTSSWQADAQFDNYVQDAYAEGWQNYYPDQHGNRTRN